MVLASGAGLSTFSFALRKARRKRCFPTCGWGLRVSTMWLGAPGCLRPTALSLACCLSRTLLCNLNAGLTHSNVPRFHEDGSDLVVEKVLSGGAVEARRRFHYMRPPGKGRQRNMLMAVANFVK
eukprot:6082007-Amphidinium_carterae.1